MTDMNLDEAQLDRAAGVLLAQACGDALGAHYEFHEPMSRDERARCWGGRFRPGEWTDDTEMAACIGDALLEEPIGSDATYDRIAELFLA